MVSEKSGYGTFSFPGVPYRAPLGVLGSPRGSLRLLQPAASAGSWLGWLALAGLLLRFRLDFGLILGLGWLRLRNSTLLGFGLSFTRILIGFGLISA